MDEGKLRKSSWMAAVKKFVGLSFVQRHCPSQPCKLYVNPLWGKVHVEVRVDGSGGGGAIAFWNFGSFEDRSFEARDNRFVCRFDLARHSTTFNQEGDEDIVRAIISISKYLPYRSSCSHLHLLSSIISLFILLFVILDDADGSIIKDEYSR